ncbi:hypothetical protein B0J12DRAFT_774339 [Macrophomina phaseolina]|uniref:Uncharacterized protein n=1 Tax=Macrophomina phaseolina TaxID=35725 RepID=A0ABQ8GIN9_9PEZI|nr:hypothetical protein B0J12DRAFT_774339 [Macrophomina phaseolina]
MNSLAPLALGYLTTSSNSAVPRGAPTDVVDHLTQHLAASNLGGSGLALGTRTSTAIAKRHGSKHENPIKPFKVNSKTSIRRYWNYKKLYNERKWARRYRKQFSLMALPTEIRVMIWGHLLISHKPFELWAWGETVRGPSWEDFMSAAPRLAVLRLNKAIRNEAAEVFYSKNEFRFSRVNAWMMLDAFLAQIRPFNIGFLRTIAIDIGFGNGSMLASATARRHFEASVLGRRNLAPQSYFPRGWAGIYSNAFHKACSRLAQAGGLRTLRLLLPAGTQLYGPYDYTRQVLVCDESCANTARDHVRAWHRDRCFWRWLEGLRSSVPGLAIGVVVVHAAHRLQEIEDGHSPDDYRAALASLEWVLFKARKKGFGIGHTSRVEVSYDDDVMEGAMPGWEFPTETSNCAIPRGE